MVRNGWRYLAAGMVVALLACAPALAQGRGNHSSAAAWRGSHRSGNDRDRDRDWRGGDRRWTMGNNNQPAGWSKGKKTGWGDCDVPPGQAKKNGCWSAPRSRSRDRRIYRRRSGNLHRRDRDRDRDDDRDRRRY